MLTKLSELMISPGFRRRLVADPDVLAVDSYRDVGPGLRAGAGFKQAGLKPFDQDGAGCAGCNRNYAGHDHRGDIESA